MGVMTLGAETGSIIIVRVEGEDENEAMNAIEDLVKNEFYEE
jgi:phosphotransferase system HPr (HPr) family protein